jgi:hypothetical protein
LHGIIPCSGGENNGIIPCSGGENNGIIPCSGDENNGIIPCSEGKNDGIIPVFECCLYRKSPRSLCKRLKCTIFALNKYETDAET